MAQIHSFYVSNIKKELRFYNNNFVEIELHNNALSEMVFAKVDNHDSNESKEN